MRELELQRENETLRERIRQLEEIIGVSRRPPWPFGLSGKEEAVLNLLISGGIVSKDQAIDLIYFDRPNNAPQAECIGVYVCKLRKKLEPFGIKIDTLWGRGYSMSGESKAQIKKYAEQYKATAA